MISIILSQLYFWTHSPLTSDMEYKIKYFTYLSIARTKFY